MLRASSQTHAESVDLNVVMSGEFAGDVPHGRELVALAEAVVSNDPDTVTPARDALVQAIGEAGMVDAVGVASNFQRMVRIADSTGITLGNFEAITEDIREDLGINAFARAATAYKADFNFTTPYSLSGNGCTTSRNRATFWHRSISEAHW